MSTVLHLITGLEPGGAEHMLVRLVTRLDRDRHRSVVVSMTGPGALGPALAKAGIELFSLGMRRGLPDPRGLARLVGVLRRVRPGILQSWLYHADLLGLLAWHFAPRPCRLFWNVRCTESVDAGLVRRLLAFCSAFPDLVVVNSHAGQRFHQNLGYRPKRWAYIPNGCDTALFRFDARARRALRNEWRIADETVAIGMPARHHPMKDHQNFLAAAARLAASRPDDVFVLAGAGVEAANRSLADAIARHGLGDRVRLLGNRDDIARVYSALDIATLSSAYGEGWPNVIGEAMSCGLPCAVTDCGDAAELVGTYGVVVPPRDPAALAAAWRRLAEIGPAARQSLGAGARRHIIEHYDLAAIARRYEDLYE